MRRIAFFDFDGTLTLKDSSRLCALPSVKLGLLDLRAALGIGAAFCGYKCGVYPRHKAHLLALGSFAGKSLDEIRRAIAILHERVIRHWYSASMMERVRQHQAQGDLLVIATASFNLLPEPLASAWGFDAIIGTELGFAGEVCTGRVVGHVVETDEKLRLARRFAQERGVALDDCSFYSDGILDLPLMEAVGRPVAVSPCRRLRRIALQRNWEIVGQSRLLAPAAGLRDAAE
ncbi:MAG TPA: HAD family phosphatase [Pseudomonadales bacterium]